MLSNRKEQLPVLFRHKELNTCLYFDPVIPTGVIFLNILHPLGFVHTEILAITYISLRNMWSSAFRKHFVSNSVVIINVHFVSFTVYTLFAVFEYIVVSTNILFHGWHLVIDMGDAELIVLKPQRSPFNYTSIS